MTLRALDDIKESVRAAAATLVRTLRGLTLRVADPQLSLPAHAKAAIAVALPLLLEKGATRKHFYVLVAPLAVNESISIHTSLLSHVHSFWL